MNTEYIINSYTKDLKSTRDIAKELNTYPNKIRRILIKNGISLRDKAESSTLSMKQGKIFPPMSGRNEQEKIDAALKARERWKNKTDEEKQQFVDGCKQRWKKLPKAKKEQMNKKAAKEVAKAAKEGSKIEKWLKSHLEDKGYHIVWHKKGLVSNEKLEVDLFISDLNIAIELDGPTHFQPIWGEEKLKETIAKDNRKNGLLLDSNISIIRVKNPYKHTSDAMLYELLNNILSVLPKTQPKKAFLKEIHL